MTQRGPEEPGIGTVPQQHGARGQPTLIQLSLVGPEAGGLIAVLTASASTCTHYLGAVSHAGKSADFVAGFINSHRKPSIRNALLTTNQAALLIFSATNSARSYSR